METVKLAEGDTMVDELTEEQKKNRKLGEEEVAMRIELGKVGEPDCLYNQEIPCKNPHLWVPRFGKVTRDPETQELSGDPVDPMPPDKEQCALCMQAAGNVET